MCSYSLCVFIRGEFTGGMYTPFIFAEIRIRGIARLFKIRGWQVGHGEGRGKGKGEGADWDSKLRPSVDPYTKCHFIWGRCNRGRASYSGSS